MSKEPSQQFHCSAPDGFTAGPDDIIFATNVRSLALAQLQGGDVRNVAAQGCHPEGHPCRPWLPGLNFHFRYWDTKLNNANELCAGAYFRCDAQFAFNAKVALP
ncbi:MAG: hypothetical protein WC829_10240 [Hyphomicrobium sp.]